MFSRQLIQKCRCVHTCNRLENAPAQQILQPSSPSINKIIKGIKDTSPRDG